MTQPPIIDSTVFFQEIEDKVKRGASYIDAVVQWCTDRNLEIEAGAELVVQCPLIKARMELEAESLSLLKEKTGHLQF